MAVTLKCNKWGVDGLGLTGLLIKGEWTGPGCVYGLLGLLWIGFSKGLGLCFSNKGISRTKLVISETSGTISVNFQTFIQGSFLSFLKMLEDQTCQNSKLCIKG